MHVRIIIKFILCYFTIFCSQLLFLMVNCTCVAQSCLYNFSQSISSIISSMLTVPMTGLKNSSATTLALINLSRKRALFSSANLAWCALCVILMCSLRICWVPCWSPWMYFTHCRPGRSGGENRRKIFHINSTFIEPFTSILNISISAPSQIKQELKLPGKKGFPEQGQIPNQF